MLFSFERKVCMTDKLNSNTYINSDYNSKSAQKGALLGIIVYLMLALIKLSVADLYAASSLEADGFNNLSDIIASLAVWLGLKLANRPADENHSFGHEKYEALSSFLVSLIMFIIGLQVILTGLQQLISRDYSQTSALVFITTFFSIFVLLITHQYIQFLARKTHSIGLKATSKDMKNDILISISTLFGAIAVKSGWPVIDTALSILVGIAVIYSAYGIFRESTFTLSDGIDQDLLTQYQHTIEQHPKVIAVNNIRGRTGTNQIYLDVTIVLDPHMSVLESHNVTEELELILAHQHHVRDVDIHVEPFIK